MGAVGVCEAVASAVADGATGADVAPSVVGAGVPVPPEVGVEAAGWEAVEGPG